MLRRRKDLKNLDNPAITAHREMMIQKQIIKRGITSKRTISAMRAVPRHAFLPQKMWSHAYDDCPQSIGHGQTISQPYIVSLMTSQFESLPKGSKILEIGSGCGYQTALFVEMGFEVHSVEIVPKLAKRSQQILAQLSLLPSSLTNGNGRLGLPGIAPFSGILAAACGEAIPETWLQQLASPGIIIAPIEGEMNQQLTRIEKNEQGKTTQKDICPVRFVKLH
jgi:protein-L-isoaspartate(D-aspartate) O-methyltransferase